MGQIKCASFLLTSKLRSEGFFVATKIGTDNPPLRWKYLRRYYELTFIAIRRVVSLCCGQVNSEFRSYQWRSTARSLDA